MGWVGLSYFGLAHAQLIIHNGVIITPPHESKQPSRQYCLVKEVERYLIGVVACSMHSIPNFVILCSTIL
jgi:hypothetical protein